MDAAQGPPPSVGARLMDGMCGVTRLFIFNDKFGNDSDNEIGKVLYFYPSGTDKDSQLKQVGLSEAIVKFATKFNTKLPCESLHTQKYRYVFHTPEPGYWFVLVLTIPSIKRQSPEGIEFIEYLGDEVQDDVFRLLLQKFYKKFVLLNNTMEVINETEGLEELRSSLKRFFDTTVAKLDPGRCGVSEVFTGLQFFPLERSMFLKIQCFINKLLLTWPLVKYSLLLQGDRLIWSGLEQSSIQIFFDFLVNDLLSKHFLTGADRQSTFGFIYKKESRIALKEELTSQSSEPQLFSAINNEQNAMSLNTSVMTASDNVSTTSTYMSVSTNTIINGSNEEADNGNGEEENNGQPLYKKFHLLIYKAEQSYLVLLIPDSEELSQEVVSKLESFLNVNFTAIARQIAQVPSITTATACSPQIPGIMHNAAGGLPTSETVPPNVKFIYFNSLNLAERASPGIRYEIDAYKLLADLKTDLARTSESGEITMKAVSETWIVAKTANGREFYAIFNQTGANVLDIDEELRKLADAQLTNIFFQD